MLRWSMLVVGVAVTSAFAQDAERATHGDDAASPQVAFETSRDGLVVRQYQLGCLSQLTYLLACDGVAVVVDPQRDVDHYVRDATALKAAIRYVVLTHTNADFVAGHTELAQRSGAQILISAESGSKFPHRGMKDGERVELGRASLELIATPGHTLDSMTVLVRAGGAADPLCALTGDALFIGSIGRPDLAQGTIAPAALADLAYDSVQRFKRLPDATIVLPAHGAGSLCGAHLSPDTHSTIGREKATNPYLRIASRSAFVARDVSGLPPVPGYFAANVAINRSGPPLVERDPALPVALDGPALTRALADGAWVVDVRDVGAYAAGHLAGSINVAVRGRLDTWTGSVVPFAAPIILVGSDDEVREAAFRVKRIGIDRVHGRMDGRLEAAREAGLAVRTTELVAPAALAARIAAGTEPVIVDVRTASERAELRIGDYLELDITDWERLPTIVDRERPLLFVCNSAYRSSMAVGLAERLGFTRLASLDGGLDAWIQAGQPVYGTASVCAGPVCPDSDAAPAAGPPASTAAFALPEPIEPEALATMLQDQPDGWTILDLRPAWQFADYHVAGATNVLPRDAVAHVRALPRGRRVVLVDRDGTLAYAVAGAIATALGDDAPALRVVAGGTARYWRDVEVAGTAPSGGAAPPPSPGAAPAPPAPPPSPAPPAPPKKRSAGC